MKRLIITLSIILCGALATLAQAPQWVIDRPISSTEYIGIGYAPLSDPDHQQVATQLALADIASQIALKVESNSLFQKIDLDGKSHEILEEQILNSAQTWIEGHQLVDSYQSTDTYYVYYSLNKSVYAKNAEKRRKQAVSVGLDYLYKGQTEEANMNLSQAASMYIKGIEAVQPWAFMDLSTRIDGMQINVPIELYNACVNLYGGMSITTNVSNVEAQMYKAVAEPLAGCLSKNGLVVPNVPLQAVFVKGAGDITPAIATDYNGTSEFYVSNITSKEQVQDIRIEIAPEYFEQLPALYREIFLTKSLPSAKITLSLQEMPITAYFSVSFDHDLEGIETRISSILANNHFTFTENQDEAQCFIELSTKLDIGNVVTGGAYDLNTYYCSLFLKIYNNSTNEILLDYSVNNVKVLSPTTKSVADALNTCNREVFKRVNSELPKQIKKLRIY